MMVLGLDIGSNSVGSSWADLEKREVHLAASVFPAGVDESDTERGAPVNQDRRQARSQRRLIHRRARRKRRLVRFLMEQGFLPRDAEQLKKLMEVTEPWELRRRALDGPLTPHEFGRVVWHLAQRRGAVGVISDPEDKDEGKVKEGMDRLKKLMKGPETFPTEPGTSADALQNSPQRARTVGELLARLREDRKQKSGKVEWHEPIRNRLYRMPEDQQLFAGRDLIQEEFHVIVKAQRAMPDSPLAALLSDELVRKLDDPTPDKTFRHSGLLFGQRRTYWDTGTLGRCDLEPTERCIPIADRHASYFRVVETVNNLRIERRGEVPQPLTPDQRAAVIKLLRGPLMQKKKGKLEAKQSASVTDLKEALELPPRDKSVRLNIESDPDRDINTDWFYREIVHGAFGEARWLGMTEQAREGVNRSLLKFDPDEPAHAAKLLAGAPNWWGLDAEAARRLAEAWKKRPKLEKRLNLSRKAILNLLPLMERFDEAANRWPTQQEARKAYAATLSDEHARRRYDSAAPGLTAADRYYMKLSKHQIAPGLPEPPPAPTLANPVVRKAIHEVRRHLIAWMRKFGRKPDRVIIELARITKESEKSRNAALDRNRKREKIRQGIREETLPHKEVFGERAARLSLNQVRSAEDRVLLSRQQTQVCPYCGQCGLTELVAAKGDDVEVDHIVPYSRCGDNGLNNKVLVHRTCNRGKANQTPREWWGGAFAERSRYAEKLFKGAEPEKSDFFGKRDYARKWENFNRELRPEDEWRNSQLTDTAYAARQVAAYLADALFDGRGLPERGDGEEKQRIFFTVGKLTATLRRDWQLFETLARTGDGPDGPSTAAEQRELAGKDRGDHRQHAIDAAVIALTDPKIKHRLASEAARAAEFHEEHGKWPRRTPIAPPWGTLRDFRRQVLSQVYERFDDSEPGQPALIVSHRPVKRRLVGAFHKATLYGAVLDAEGNRIPDRARIRQPIFASTQDHLKPAHLRLPQPEPRNDSIRRIAEQLARNGMRRREAKAKATVIVSAPSFKPPLVDPSPEKSGIVRDLGLRRTIRDALVQREINPDDFTAAQLKASIERDGPLRHLSGIPIKSAALLWANSDPVVMKRRRWNYVSGEREPDPSPRGARLYDAQNNHHIEIRADHNGKWFGQVIKTFDAAQRNVERLKQLRAAGIPAGGKLRRMNEQERGAFKRAIAEVTAKFPIVDRRDSLDGKFIMSLAEGEMVHMRHPETKVPGYFVVFKLDSSNSIHLKPHWDARRAKGAKDESGRVLPESVREDVSVTPEQLRHLGINPGEPPQKVRVSPIGLVTPLPND